jgi:putative transposase
MAAGAPSLPSEQRLREAFMWRERRRVSKTATFSMHGNTYEVDPELAGFHVELVFDPFDLAEVEVRRDRRPAGRAVPLAVRRHVHPRAQGNLPERPEPTAIDYLGLIAKRRERQLRQRIDYRDLSGRHTDDDDRKESQR